MVARVSVQMDIEALSRTLNASAKNIRFAAAASLTHVAKSSQKQLTTEIGQKFDKPTPWIRKSAFVKPATKEDLTAEVGIKDQGARATPSDYIKEHFGGGSRTAKPYERALAAMGVLPSGWRAVPGADLELDSYGNPRRKALTEIFNALRTGLGVNRGRGAGAVRVG